MDNHSRFNAFFRRMVPWRIYVQAAFLLVWLDPLRFRMHNICAPVFHCYACPLAAASCPIGVVAQFGALHLIPLIAIGTILLFAALLGSLICGWVCPFGLLQDLAARTPIRKFRIPRWMGHFRYVVLIGGVLLVPWLWGEAHSLFICRICPAGALESAVPASVGQALRGETVVWPNALKLTILAVFLGAIFLSVRPWCRILCPLGVVFSSFNRISIFSLGLNKDACTNCGACRKRCSYGCTPDQGPNSAGCIRCLECLDCRPGALQAQTLLTAPAPKAPAAPTLPHPTKSA